jgi:MFS family permease
VSFADENGVRERTAWSRVGFGVALGAFASYQQFKLPPILPDFLARYPHSPVVAAGLMSAYPLVGLLASAPIAHRLEGRFGPAIIALFGLTVIGITVALLAPQSDALMLASRALEGLGFTIAAIVAPTISVAAARPRDLPVVTGLFAGWIPLGQIGAALVALLVGDWHWLWLIGLLLIVPLAFWARSSLRAREGDAARQPRQATQRPDPHQHQRLLLAAAIFLLWSTQYFAFMTWLTQYLTTALDLGREASVLAYLLPVVVLLGFTVLTGWGLRHGVPLIPALVAALVAQAAIWFSQPWLNGGLGIIGLIVYGVGAGITPTCLFQLPHAIARGTAGAVSFGILMTGRNIGVFLGPIILIVLIGSEPYALGLGWTGGARAMAVLTLLAALVGLGLGRRLRNP